MKNYITFIIICALSLCLSEVSRYLLDLNGLLYKSLMGQLNKEQVDSIFEGVLKWQFLGYLLIPITIFLKTHAIALVLGVGSFFLDVKIAYRKLWNIVLKAEFIFLFVGVMKLVWFGFIRTDFGLEEVETFYPLSMLSMIGDIALEPWYVYPLQVINAFEIVYWIVLALLLDKALNMKKGNLGIKIVATSYGPALLIWVVAVMFFTLNMS